MTFSDVLNFIGFPHATLDMCRKRHNDVIFSKIHVVGDAPLQHGLY